MIGSLFRSRIALLILLVLVGAAAWYGLKATVLAGPEAPEYQTAEVTRGNIEVTISAAGKIRPKESVDVGAQVSGQLQELLVEIGDEVEKGDLLARSDPTIAQTSVEANRAQVGRTCRVRECVDGLALVGGLERGEVWARGEVDLT